MGNKGLSERIQMDVAAGNGGICNRDRAAAIRLAGTPDHKLKREV